MSIFPSFLAIVALVVVENEAQENATIRFELEDRWVASLEKKCKSILMHILS